MFSVWRLGFGCGGDYIAGSLLLLLVLLLWLLNDGYSVVESHKKRAHLLIMNEYTFCVIPVLMSTHESSEPHILSQKMCGSTAGVVTPAAGVNARNNARSGR